MNKQPPNRLTPQTESFVARLRKVRIRHSPNHLYVAGNCFKYGLVDHLDARKLARENARYGQFDLYEPVLGDANFYPFHHIIDFETVLQKGFCGIRADAEHARLRFEAQGDQAGADLCAAAVVVCDAVSEFAERYSSEIASLAQSPDSKDAATAGALLSLSRVVARVPVAPAGTFHEALQSTFFAWSLNGDGLGRLDLLLRDYYKRDIRAGHLSRSEAKQMIVDLFRQINEQLGEAPGQVTYFNRTITLGGMDLQGRDITNDLTYLFLEVTEELAFTSAPAVYLRVGMQTPDRLLRKAVDGLSAGTGYPSFFNDEVFVPALHRVAGCSLEDARDYAPTGCGEMTIPGRAVCNCALSQMNVLLVALLTINDGRHPDTGQQLGPHTGEFETFASFDALFFAFEKQMTFFIGKAVERAAVIMEDIHGKNVAAVYNSTLTRDCIERGRTFCAGGSRYTFAEFAPHGLSNAIDALAMIRKHVYEGKLASPLELKAALAADYVGRETLRLRLLNDPDRWGNDEDAVDGLAREVFHFVFQEISRHRNFYGGPCLAMGISFTNNQELGLVTPASPDGRRRGEPLAAVNSSVHGCDRNGLTALFNSLAKIDWSLAPGSVQCGIAVHPSMLRSAEDRDKFVALLKTQIGAKGFSQLLCNVVDDEMLRQAVLEPQRFKHINVRVSGYNARFVDLPAAVQNEILQRSKHGGKS